MKILITLFLSIILMSNLFGQKEKEINKILAKDFELQYNSGFYNEIFNLFSSEMQKALPFDKTEEFLKGLNAQVGKISSMKFSKYEKSYASYKTIFENGLFAINISVDNNSKINGLFVKPFVETNFPKLERNITKMALPFKGEWSVTWGGDTKELNYHVESEAQKNAFDILIKGKNGNSFRTDGKTNADYYAFGKELFAPADGEIVLVVDGVKDNIPGELNPIYIPGNTVIIKTANNEYLFFAHFKQNSIVVKQGQIIKQGQLLGLCGNSGNSSEAHIHFHIQNVENMIEATGVKCYFEKLKVNGTNKSDYSPIKDDIISNE
jgi:hypothetical protein